MDRDEMLKKMGKVQLLHNYYNVLDDINEWCDDKAQIIWDEGEKFMPGTISYYCRKCQCMMTFYSYSTNHEDKSTYLLFDVINDQPMITFRKIYKCSCGREFVTVTQFFEQVGSNTNYGFNPIIYKSNIETKETKE